MLRSCQKFPAILPVVLLVAGMVPARVLGSAEKTLLVLVDSPEANVVVLYLSL